MRQYKFSCPKCQISSFQEKKFDVNTTKFLGTIQVQMDYNQFNGLIEFTFKGLLPLLIVIPLIL